MVNDALIALQAAVGEAPGIVIVSGTGSIAYGRDRAGHAARAGGWGYVLGDEGSGYWIGRLAMRAVVRAADGRGSPTSLTERLLAHFGAQRPDELLQTVYHASFRPAAFTALAAHVQQAREDGDLAAATILDRAAQELLEAASSVIAQLNLAKQEFAFVLSGGMFKAVPWLRSSLRVSCPRSHRAVT